MKNLIVLVGATGVGKTEMSIKISNYFNAPILSSDSRQIYKEMRIGTAVPTKEELETAPHHLIQEISVTEEFNAGRYESLAMEKLEELYKTHDNVLLVGGSGLYINALCNGLDDTPDTNHALREELILIWHSSQEGRDSLLNELKERDPEFYEVVDKMNHKRVVRAIEVCRQSGGKYSDLRIGEKKKRPFNIIKIGLRREREELYQRINKRVDIMIEEGLIEEAKSLIDYRHYNALQTVGYKEFFDYFDGTISKEEAIELLKRDTRRYAKRQTTWFGREADIKWFHPEQIDEAIGYIGMIENKLPL